MARSLKIHQPRLQELRKLDRLVADDLHPRSRRRAQVIALYGEGLQGVEIAAALRVHPQTVYQDLRAFDAAGLACLRPPLPGGVPRCLTAAQEAEMRRLADLSPVDVGLPYGRWSLNALREYLLKERIVAGISREHLRRVLKKGVSASGVSVANSSAATRSASPS